MSNIAIIGGGSWGLAISLVLYNNNHRVKVWEYLPENVEKLNQQRQNDDYLKGVIFPEDIVFSNNIDDVILQDTDILVFAVPSSFLRKTVQFCKHNISRLSNLKSIVSLVKGLEENSLKRMSEVIKEELPLHFEDKICSLSGPSHAEEVAKQIPTLVVVAGSNLDVLQYTQNNFSNSYLRVYTSVDIIGIEIGAAVKNIIAIAAGIVSGLGFGDNTMGALLTRGLAEIKRLGCALNAEPDTFSGLSGLGDLITTSISVHSRNRHVGYELGKGKTLETILSEMVMIAEGVITTKNIRELKDRLGVSMPITEQMYQILYHGKPAIDGLKDLMLRDLRCE